MDIIKVFSGNVKRYRKEKGYSQEYFAELCGISDMYIRQLNHYKFHVFPSSVLLS